MLEAKSVASNRLIFKVSNDLVYLEEITLYELFCIMEVFITSGSLEIHVRFGVSFTSLGSLASVSGLLHLPVGGCASIVWFALVCLRASAESCSPRGST